MGDHKVSEPPGLAPSSRCSIRNLIMFQNEFQNRSTNASSGCFTDGRAPRHSDALMVIDLECVSDCISNTVLRNSARRLGTSLV